MSSPVRVRLAPSPTGPLHVGTARTALLNFLFARHHGGQFLLRIEDTDRARSRTEYTEQILQGLRWLGITWDEGPDTGGTYGPYLQSLRHHVYTEALERLLAAGQAYEQEGAIVLRATRGEPMIVHDLIRGDVSFAQDQIKDFVIAKPRTDGSGEGKWDPLFHLSVVVDDAAMNITHVIRGEDHLSNTPKHLLLQQALGFPTPAYAHLPLLLDAQRHKLSKRTATTGVESYQQQGYLPEALLNFLALLGWNPKTTEEVFTIPELIERFSLSGIQKGGAVFDVRKLDWLQKQHMQRLSHAALWSRAKPFLEPLVEQASDSAAEGIIERALCVWQARGDRFDTLTQDLQWCAVEPTPSPSDLRWKDTPTPNIREALHASRTILMELPQDAWSSGEELQDTLRKNIDAAGWDRATILWPLRVALSGQRQSPSPGEIAWALGLAHTLKRIERAEKILENIDT